MVINTPLGLEECLVPMTYLIQTRVNTGNLPQQRGNSFPTVIACLMGLTDPEQVFQVQEHYDRDQAEDADNWVNQLQNWLLHLNYEWQTIEGHQHNDVPYLVVGQSPRGLTHVCIYKNGQLLHDPHPEGGGLLTETHFEILVPLPANGEQ